MMICCLSESASVLFPMSLKISLFYQRNHNNLTAILSREYKRSFANWLVHYKFACCRCSNDTMAKFSICCQTPRISTKATREFKISTKSELVFCDLLLFTYCTDMLNLFKFYLYMAIQTGLNIDFCCHLQMLYNWCTFYLLVKSLSLTITEWDANSIPSQRLIISWIFIVWKVFEENIVQDNCLIFYEKAYNRSSVWISCLISFLKNDIDHLILVFMLAWGNLFLHS